MKPSTVTVQCLQDKTWLLEISRYAGESPFIIIVGNEADARQLESSYSKGLPALMDRPPRARAFSV